MRSALRTVTVLGLSLGLTTGLVLAADHKKEEKPKHTIKEVMTKAHKKGKDGTPPTCEKAAKGNASEAELKQLLEYYRSLAAQKPKKGDAESWKKKTEALISATEGLIKGGDGLEQAKKDYAAAVNCKACHDTHK
jgi:cytochrome c553